MTASAAAAAEKRTSYLELFFDLVFVFAITQLAGMLHADHTARGWVHAGIMAWLVWWAWSQYTWAGNAIDLDRRSVRIVVLAVSGTTLLAAIAIPDAFAYDGLWFAIPYAVIRFAGLALYWGGLRHDPAHRAALRTYLPIASIGPTLVLLGGWAGTDVRPWIWAAAMVVDVASVAAAGRGEFRIAPGHFAERHALIVIIALGESIVAVGATATDLGPSIEVFATAMLGFVIACALWWDYFDRLHGSAEARLVAEPDHRRRSNLARDLFTLGHFPLLIGTVLFAVGVEEAIVHPGAPLEPFGRLAVGSGLALFLLGFVVTEIRATGNLLVERLATAGTSVAIVAAVGGRVSALALLGLLALTVGAAAALETLRAIGGAVPSTPAAPDPSR
jgi:low temperature requirement protein LtrA